MKLLIIGAKGMLGQSLAEVFADENPILWDKEEIDITQAEDSRRKIIDLRPEVIVNCAAMTDVDGCEDRPQLAHALNGEAPGNLALAANSIGALLVHYSTAYVFDGKNPGGYREDDMPTPLSIYGKTKLQGERGAAMADRYYILRLDRLFGRAGGGKASFVDKILELARKNTSAPSPSSPRAGGEIRVIDDEYGCPTYAPDLAARTREIIRSNPSYGIYHATNAGSCSWYEWVEAIFKIREIKVELAHAKSADFPRKAIRPQYGILQNSKLPPMRSWQEATKEFLVSSF